MGLSHHIEALKQKDQLAFEAIYHDTKHAVFAMILPIVKDRSLAEDVMQETYIKMVENINRYNKKYKFINWLLTIAKNQAIDYYRKRKSELSDSSEHLDLYSDSSTPIETKLEAKYYLSLLTDEERQIVLLKTVGNMKHRDIALMLEKPIGTITWKYNEAIKKMKEGASS